MFHQITIDKDTIPLTAFCTPTRLFEWLVTPQGSSALPGWFVKVINEVIKDLERVAAYLHDVIVFDPDPASHVDNIRALFQRLRKHNLKLSPPKAKLGATNADFLGHTISSAGVSPNADKVTALTKMPMPTNVKQLRSLLGGMGYYRKFITNMSTRLRPVNALLKQGVKLTQLWKPSSDSFSTTSPSLLSWSTQKLMPLPTIPDPSACTVTPAAMTSA